MTIEGMRKCGCNPVWLCEAHQRERMGEHLAVFGATSRGDTTMECSCGSIDPDECAQATLEAAKQQKARTPEPGGRLIP